METAVETKRYQARAGWLESAVETLCAAGIEVLAPTEQTRQVINFAPVTSAAEIVTDNGNVNVPLKEVLFPRTEVLLEYQKLAGGKVAVSGEHPPPKECVVLGARPCDAAALEVLDALFEWDYEDAPYAARRENTTIVTWACTKPGKRCFCLSVGGSPHDTRGSDILVYGVEDGGAILEVLTSKGERLVERLGDGLEPATVEVPAPPALERKFDITKVKTWLDDNFESEFWEGIARRCLGCGQCSFLCPTCHCFDIVDESNWHSGQRRRNWDCCAFSTFTLHASGHNPRSDQAARCRQRVMHKFKYFPERFGKVACVGCGRCVTRCGVGQNLVNILTDIESR